MYVWQISTFFPFSSHLSVIWLLFLSSQFLNFVKKILVPINEPFSWLQTRASFLSERQCWASAPCRRAVCQRASGSQITLWWRVAVVIVVCTLHLPSDTYEDLWKERTEQQEPALTWQARMATGREAGRTEAGGRLTRGWWELLWPSSGGHNAQVESWLSGCGGGQIMCLLFRQKEKDGKKEVY